MVIRSAYQLLYHKYDFYFIFIRLLYSKTCFFFGKSIKVFILHLLILFIKFLFFFKMEHPWVKISNTSFLFLIFSFYKNSLSIYHLYCAIEKSFFNSIKFSVELNQFSWYNTIFCGKMWMRHWCAFHRGKQSVMQLVSYRGIK